MNRIVIPLIVLAGVIAAISIVSLTIDDSTNEPSNRHDKNTKTLEELTAMNCEEILKENIKGLQYFTKEQGGEYIEQKVFECLRNQIPITESYQIPSLEFGELDELIELDEMTCPEIVERNTIGGQYVTKENREFVREKVGDCSDVEEWLAATGSCEAIYERYHSGEPYLFESHKTISENQLAKCDEFGYDVINLKEINYSCKYADATKYSFVEFDNGTHYINNETCEWKIRDLPVYPGMGNTHE